LKRGKEKIGESSAPQVAETIQRVVPSVGIRLMATPSPGIESTKLEASECHLEGKKKDDDDKKFFEKFERKVGFVIQPSRKNKFFK